MVALGLIALFIGFYHEIINWLSKYGLVLIVILVPLIIFVANYFVNKKIKDM